ncbi:MAG: DEAD/DEAH box helicase [Candidatus Omnitrophica bacterium]|nr:DEAD/DEAH box helicase [Candidatus Omnitrophota bacterium]
MRDDIRLDPFQKKAINFLEKGFSVIVAAPTGAGKTLIAEYVIEDCIRKGKGVIYTAPIKALSNQKFRDFSKQFPQRVGIITGDVRINPGAELLIMTTEIFRNYLLQDPDKLQNKEWVIFDEIHYLDDIERGTVWEESIIFLPPHMKILALSATLPNIDELLGWIRKVHRYPVKKVEEDQRPVPLHFYFQADDVIFSSFKNLTRYIRRNKDKFFKNNRLLTVVDYLKKNDFLPCIYFCFSRTKCERLATELTRFNFLTSEENRKICDLYYHYTKKFKIQDQESTSLLYSLIQKGIAYHHAGLLPPLKEIVERLFTEKLIKVIFTTETFALGINMPSRTVCFDEISKYYRGRRRYLRIRDFYQMAGRAGRRGIDEEGFVFVRLRPFKQDVEAISRILEGKPEPIRSQFNASYATILNLYRDLKEKLLEIYPSTFHYFQFGRKRKSQRKILESKLSLLKYLGYIRKNKLTSKGIFASNIFGYELIISELWERNYFENLSWKDLGVVICATVTEVRPGEKMPRLDKRTKKLKTELEQTARKIQKIERKFKIYPQIKTPHFQLANAIKGWVEGKRFGEILELTHSDEGEIIRNFRMTIQVLRDMNQEIISENLRNKIQKLFTTLNRDLIDAEWQLKI